MFKRWIVTQFGLAGSILASLGFALCVVGLTGLVASASAEDASLARASIVQLIAGATGFGLSFLPSKLRVYVAIIICTSGPSLLAAELFLTLNKKPAAAVRLTELGDAWAELDQPFDRRTPWEVVHDLRAEGIRAYPKINPGYILQHRSDGSAFSPIKIGHHEVMPLSTISNVRSVYCNEMGDYLIYVSDERGFHNPPGAWDVPVLDAAILGDSFAEGACVRSDQNIAAHLRKEIPALANLGMGSNGPLISLAAMTEYLTEKRPRTVLWFYYEGNDLDDLAKEIRLPILRSYLEDGFVQNLIGQTSEVDEALIAYLSKDEQRPQTAEGISFRRIVGLQSLRNTLGLIRSGPNSSDDTRLRVEQNLAEIFTLMHRRISSWGGELFLVYLPAAQRYLNTNDKEALDKQRKTVLTLAQGLEIPTIDIVAAWSTDSDPASYYVLRGLGHFVPNANADVAAQILEGLAQHGLVSDPLPLIPNGQTRH